MGLSILDWAMVLVILLSTLQAIAEGFFHEFFGLAGTIVGYLAAAWEYHRLAAWYSRYVTSQWAADIAGFFTIFLAIVLLAGYGRAAGTLGGTRDRAAMVRSFPGWSIRVHSRLCN